MQYDKTFLKPLEGSKVGTREVKLFPWTNTQVPAPWPAGYSRVMVPFNATEQRNAKPGKTHHILVVRSERLSSKG